jgi:hypothetical protein
MKNVVDNGGSGYYHGKENPRSGGRGVAAHGVGRIDIGLPWELTDKAQLLVP